MASGSATRQTYGIYHWTGRGRYRHDLLRGRNIIKYFLDSEFQEDGVVIKPFSLALVAEDGRELYFETPLAAEARAYPERFDPWLQANVIPGLGSGALHGVYPCMARTLITDFVDPALYGEPKFWGWYCDYDWVLFCQIFGKMIDLPKGFPMYCNDVKQLAMMCGNPQLPKQAEGHHHALADARDIRDKHAFLVNFADGIMPALLRNWYRKA